MNLGDWMGQELEVAGKSVTYAQAFIGAVVVIIVGLVIFA